MKKGIYISIVLSLLLANTDVCAKSNSSYSFIESLYFKSFKTLDFNQFNYSKSSISEFKYDRFNSYNNLNIQNYRLSNTFNYSKFSSDFPREGNLNLPSFRKKNQWDNSMEEEFSDAEIEILNSKEEYKSTIEKIKEAEDKLISKEQKLSWISKVDEDDYMEIFMSGGGFKNGVDARLHDRIIVNNAGYVQSYYESEISGVRKTEKIVDKKDLTEFIKWIAEKGFFEFEKEYECDQSDKGCYDRLTKRPQPIPLKIVVAIGERRNVVVVPIFAPDIEKDYINYPKELKQIVEAIYLFASL